jgi:hypothetical protein
VQHASIQVSRTLSSMARRFSRSSGVSGADGCTML